MLLVKSTIIFTLFLVAIQAQQIEQDTLYSCKQDSLFFIEVTSKYSASFLG